MKYAPFRVGSISTSIATLTESRPARMLFGTLMYVLLPLKASPCPAVQDAVPFTAPLRLLPEASAATVPDVSSSLYQRARPSFAAAAAGDAGPTASEVVSSDRAAAAQSAAVERRRRGRRRPRRGMVIRTPSRRPAG